MDPMPATVMEDSPKEKQISRTCGTVCLPAEQDLHTEGVDCHSSSPEHQAGEALPAPEHLDRNDRRESLRCSTCGEIFRYPANLTQHIRIHTGEKPFVCTVCGKEFRLKHHLERHFRIHSRGKKTYYCSMCDQKFAHRFLRNKHMQTHTERTPSLCTLVWKTVLMCWKSN